MKIATPVHGRCNWGQEYGPFHPNPAFCEATDQDSPHDVNRLTLLATNLPDSCRYRRPDKPRRGFMQLQHSRLSTWWTNSTVARNKSGSCRGIRSGGYAGIRHRNG